MKKNTLKTILLAILCCLFGFNTWSQNEIAIASVSDLQKIGNDVNYPLTSSYYLTADIDLNSISDWTPIGATGVSDNNPQQFKGIFDGKGYAIKNLTITTSGNFKGLFGRLYHASVKDLDLENVNIVGLAPTGGIAGAMIGESIIERVSVTGNITGGSEIGGIVGRIARDPTYPDYNLIHDCYVNANITATKRTTDMNAPSVAGGIAAFSHSTSGGASGKIDIRRCYVAGSVISQENTSVAGNASGILTFYDNHNFVKMEEVIVLCDTIGAATSNLFFSRRGPTYADFELFNKVYARSDISLYYAVGTDKGRGGEIPEGIINYLSLETYKTKQFYDDNLTWNFDNVWIISDGFLPELNRSKSPTSNPSGLNEESFYALSIKQGILEIKPLDEFFVQIFDVTGAKIYADNVVKSTLSVRLQTGVYLILSEFQGKKFTEKVLIN
ncbi:MAG: ZmpA/ZmpB/ZmpC family metallo-endopeptidase-related protein [Paludibacteraceae bacterium]